MADKIKESKDISALIETLVPEFVTAEHPKMKVFIEKYYEFMESHQVYFEGIAFNEYKLVQEGEDDASLEPDYWILEDEINKKLMPNGDPNEFYDPRVLEGGIVNHRLQLETPRDTSKDDQLQFIIGELVYGNTTDAEAVVTGISSNTVAWLKPTTKTNFIYGEELTGVSSRAWTTFANGVTAGVFSEGSIEGFRTRGPIAATKELKDFQDIDTTVEGLIDSSWKKEFYTHVPKQAETDRRKLLKNMKEVYRAKGGESSYDWLFRALFASQDVDYYYPKKDLMRLSDGRWTKDKTVKVLTDTANNIQLFEGNEIRGLSSNATAIVEKTITKTVGQVQITELFLSKIVAGTAEDGITGYFRKYEGVETEPNANNDIARGFCSGIVEDVVINYGGTNYEIGDQIQFVSGGGAEARGEVSSLVNDILEGFRIIDAGDGYCVGDELDFIDGGTGGEGAKATVGSIISTGKILKNDQVIRGVSSLPISSNNVNKPLYANSSHTFTVEIKEDSGSVFDVSGSFFTSQFFNVGDLIRKQKRINSDEVYTTDSIGITLTQSGTTVTLSDPLSTEEVKTFIGGKLTYANGNNNIIAGQGNTTTFYTRDAHTIASDEDFNIYYGDESINAPSGTVVGANSSVLLYTLNSVYIDELGNQTITNFSNNDTFILYDTSRNTLWGTPNANSSDAAFTHTGFVFDVSNTPASVNGFSVTLGDAFAVGGGYVQNQVNTTFNVAPILSYTEYEFGSINSLAITSGGKGYKRVPIITVANTFMTSMGNSGEHTGDMNSLLNVNLHSYSTGTITQLGQELTLSGGAFPASNNNLLHITYANGFEDYITSVTNTTHVNMTTSTSISTPETYTLTYMATANGFSPNDLIYNDDYSARARVLDFIDEPAKVTFPRSIGKTYEGSYIERPGQTGYMRRNILNGNSTIRVDMLTTNDFTGTFSHILEEGTATAEGTHDRITFEDGGLMYPEDALTFILMEDSEYTHVVYEDGGRTFGEDVGSDRITAFDGLTTITYSTGTITQSGNVITAFDGSTIFPNETAYGTFLYANSLSATITEYTNSSSIIVDSSRTISTAETYSINYNPAVTFGSVDNITAVSYEANTAPFYHPSQLVVVTETGHTKTNSDKVKIDGSTNKIFNGTFTVFPIDSNTYSYVLPESTSLQPSSGLTAKFVRTSFLAASNTTVVDTSLKGNNAVVEVSSVAAGSINSIDIMNVGAGYSSSPRVLAASGNNNAQIEAVVGAFAQYPGRYIGTQGRLNDAPKIQDSRYYQSFSYVLKAPIDTTTYRAHVDRMVHPAGMKMFGELAISLKLSVELFKSGVHTGSDGLPKDVDDYDDSGYELGRPDYLHLHTNRYHPIIIFHQPPNLDSTISTYLQPEVEVFTHDAPHHAMDGRIVHRGNVNLIREDFRDVESMTRSSASMLSFIMGEPARGTLDEQYEVGETVYQGASYFTRVREATVAGYNHADKTLNLIDMIPDEDFDLTDFIVGHISAADYAILEETTRPMGDITELEHDIQVGDEIQITRAGGGTADFWNGSYIIQTVPDSNTYQVFLSRYGKDGNPYGDPGEGAEATAQTAYGGSYLKVETKALSNVWRTSSTNYGSPFSGDILHEDHVIDGVTYNFKTLLEEGDTYLLPMVEFPEAESGTVSIDMSFSSDLLLEDHINPDTAMHETGYVLSENHGAMGTGPTRYVGLEDDTEGIEWSYERGSLGHETLSIPYMETTVMPTVYENMGRNLQLEDGSHFIEEGDETSRPLSRFMIEDSHPGLRSTEYEHGKRPVGEIEFEIKQYRGWNFLLEDDETSWIANEEEDPFTGKVYKLQTEEGYFKSLAGTAGDEHRYEFDLYENIGDNLRLEDDSHMIEEGDEASNLSRFLISETSEKYFKTPVGEIEFDLYESQGYKLQLEDEISHFIEEGDETANGQCARFIMEDQLPGLHATEYEHGKRPIGEIEFELVPDNTRASISQHEEQVEVHLVADRSYFNWHLMTEDDDNLIFEETAANQWELGTKLAIENNYLKAFNFPQTEWMIDQTTYLADNPLRVYKIHHVMNQLADSEWMSRQIGTQTFGCQVGRARGSRQKYLDGSGNPGHFGEDRTLDGDAYRQNYGEAGSIPSGPGLNMNHPGRIGLFNQYWELMSIHHPIMLTGPAWWKKFELPTAVSSTPIITHSLTANTQVEQFFSEVGEKEQQRKVQDGFFELETFTTDTGTGYFVLEEFRSTGDGRTGRILTDYDISIKSVSSSSTTFISPSGQISMAGGSTTLNGTNTLFQSELSPNDIIQTWPENVIIEEDEGIIFESNERIEHEDITMSGLVEYSGGRNMSYYWNVPLEDIVWFIATEETRGHWGNYWPGTGYDQESKQDDPGSYWMVSESSLSEQEIELEINTPDAGAVGNKVVAAETTWDQQNLLLEDGGNLLLTDQAEFRIESITNDTSAIITRENIDGTGSVPFWKQSIETEVIASVSGLHY